MKATAVAVFGLMSRLGSAVGIEGALLDFYDAALWILCFFAIEMNLLRFVVPVREAQSPPA